ncbi:MAG: ABC transporter ATP-binding protein [Chloroflexota bacterium]|nr:ABC transporter ATP-binding protein [Chloroflexota bacterium]
MSGVILDVRGVSKRFGGIQAVNNASLAIREGIVTGVIGPNGSGKSTLFNLVTGLDHPDSGEIRFHGQDLARLGPDRINRLGIGRTFQLTRLFGKMTVHENLVVVSRSGRREAGERAMELLGLLGLSGLWNEYAENLSYGQQKLVEFLRLSVSDPSLILLDEPFAGVNPVMERKLLAQLHAWIDAGKTVLLTDHEMAIMMELCQEIFVLDYGEVIAQGTPEAVRADERVMEAYFGR